MITIGASISIVPGRLGHTIDLLTYNNAAVRRGIDVKPTDPISIQNITKEVNRLRWMSFGVVAVGFVVLYTTLVGIVWRGRKTILNQRRELEDFNAELETRVAARIEEIRETNFRLQSEIQERRQAETELSRINSRLEETLGELQETQRQVVQQARMQAMGEMASGVAHDFNNALAPIVAYTDLLLEIPGVLDKKEQVTTYLETVRTSAQDATNVVKRLREFYRGNESEEVLSTASVNQVVQEAVSLTQPRWKNQALAAGAEINVETELEEVPAVAMNPSELREVLTNLILNAVDAMPNGGTITLRSRLGSHGVEVEVDDTGTGMSEEVLQRCLDPFFTTKGDRGSGLGLSMVFGSVQRGGGTIDIDTEEGSGTKFVIHLPFDTTGDAETEEIGLPAPSRPLHVLTVDDDKLGQQALSELMFALGHTVDLASDGREALEKFQVGAYDVVMTDRAMPNMNGDQLSAAIKERDSGQRVIMMTGFGPIMEGNSEKPSGVDLIISKPITLSGLREALAAVTG